MPNHAPILEPIATIIAAVLIIAGMTTYSRAESARVHVTFVKGRHGVECFGNMFYAGEQYRLECEGVAAASVSVRRLDLIGTAEDMHAASDILGAYEPAESGGSTIVDNAKTVRIKNRNGAVLELQGADPGKQSVDLAGVTVKSRGWGPDAKERIRR